MFVFYILMMCAYQPYSNGETHQPSHIMDTEAFHNLGAMGLDGLDAYPSS